MIRKNCVLVCITVQKDCARLIRRGRELAAETDAALYVLHVSGEKSTAAGPDAGILNELFSLAHEAEAEMNILYENDVPAAIARYAASVGATALVIGADHSGITGRLQPLLPKGTQLIRVEEAS